jgi:membrane protein YdbS with pleckstrin-like domain
MPMLAPRDPDEYLLSTERRVIRLRRHWAYVLRQLLETVLALVVAFALSFLLAKVTERSELISVLQSILWYVALFVLLRFTYYLVEWWVERIVVTDKRFMITTGIFTTNIAMMPVSKVTDLTYQRTVFGRMLGFGTLVVESAGQIQALNKIEFVPRPEEVFDAISELVFGEKNPQRFSMLKAPPRRRRR